MAFRVLISFFFLLISDLEPIGIDELEVVDLQVENLPLEDFNPSLFSLFNAKTRKSEEIMSKKVGSNFKHKLERQISIFQKS